MSTHLEHDGSENPQTDTHSTTPKLGARAVVELLKHNQPESVPPEFMVIEHRRADALNNLITILTRFQLQITKSPYGNASILSLLTKYLVENNRVLFIAKPDLGAIRLVDQVFDELLNSDKFDQEAWCILAKTRFPIAKFALQDFSFFFAPQNNGRRLLNTITLHLLGSAEQQKGHVRDAIARFIEKLNRQYRDKPSEFNSLCIESQSYFASLQRRLHKIETKISQVESADKKSDRSEPLIIDMLNEEVAGRELPDLLVDFIYGEWRNSMRLILRQEGEHSRNWKRQVSLTQSMVQIYEACLTEEGRDQYRRFWPSMQRGIKDLLVSVEANTDAFEEAIDPLELVCSALIQGATPDLKTAPTLKSRSVVNEAFEVIPVDEKYLKQVEALNVGEWIRIRTPDSRYEACKLSLKADDAEPWVFVNNNGSKIAKKNKYALAQGLRDGVVDIVGKGQWIDDLLRTGFTTLAKLMEEQQLAEKQRQQESVLTETEEIDDETAEAEDIQLLPLEETADSDSPTPEAAAKASRTDEILTGSTLAIVSEEEAINEDSAEATGPEEEWEDYYQEEKELSQEEVAAATNAVTELEVGALVNYVVNGKEERCKLAVKMTAKNKYIFVDRVGVKVWDAKEQEVIEAVARGVLTIVDSGVRFDRALERVVKNIQADKKGRD